PAVTHLFILSGQSNMNGLDPDESFIPAVRQRFGGDNVIVVKDSQGGQPIRRWDKGWTSNDPKTQGPIGDLYDRLMTKVSDAIAGRSFQTVTFLWMQGERDAREGNADVYRDSFDRLLDQLRRDLKHAQINWVVGRLSDFGGDNPSYPQWNEMRRVLKKIGQSGPRSAWVDTDDLNDGVARSGKAIKDDLHYSANGYRIFGQRLADAAIACLERTDIPYGLAPPITTGYHRLRYAASSQAGALRYPVQYTIWIPPNVNLLRGVIVHQHGCGVGSCRSGLTGAFDLHWQALAANHDCALMAATYEQPLDADCRAWCDPRNGSDVTFRQSLREFADVSGHPELSRVPWALWGHSGGGYWSGVMLTMHPDRVAAAWLQSGTPRLGPDESAPNDKVVTLPESRIEAPVMLCLGTEEGFGKTNGRFSSVWPRSKQWFSALRQQGTPTSLAVDPLSSHQCGEQRYLAIPWFDACLKLRLPLQPGEPMPPMPTGSHWLAPVMQPPNTATAASPAKSFRGDVHLSVWLPSEAVANLWTQFSKGQPIADVSPPAAPVDVRLNDGVLTWTPKADLQSGIMQCVIYRNGKPIGRAPESTNNRFGRPLAQGLQYSDTPDLPLKTFSMNVANRDAESRSPDSTDVYTVTTINTAGVESLPSQPAKRSLEADRP
ncbi:MAG: sialate O-acetylesterase, partial [Planctomycetota bacterium]